jgi:hypothetical protein
MTPRIRYPIELVAKSDQGAGIKWLAFEGAIVEHPLSLRISREKHLKAAVEQKPLHFIGSYPTANSVRCLEHENGEPTFMERQSAGEARKASPHDQDIRTRHCHLFKGHRVAQILLAIGNPATIEADIFRIFRKPFYFLEFSLACQNTNMTRMVAGTDIVTHFFPPAHERYCGVKDGPPAIALKKQIDIGMYLIHPCAQGVFLILPHSP